MDIVSVITLLGGLAFFLFGMSLLGDSLKKVAGSRLEVFLAKLTSTHIRGILLGTFVTAVIQSSSATTVMVVGFVNSGVMKLSQAIGIIMGANIGTTATGWILSLTDLQDGGTAAQLFSVSTIFALIALIGIILYMTAHSTKKKNVGVILLAVSILMYGMQIMSGAVEPLKDSAEFIRVLTVFSNPIIGILAGTLFTAVIQSSSASVGILQALAVTGSISYDMAVPLILGMSIGACAPVLVSSIGANKNGRRAAFIYLYYNLFGSLAFMVVYYAATRLFGLTFTSMAATAVGIAIVNTVAKLFATIVLLPFMGQLEKLVYLTFKSSPEDEEYEENLLDERFLNYPPLAIEQSNLTITKMAEAAKKNILQAIDLLADYRPESAEKIVNRENVVDKYEDKLGTYLVKLSGKELSHSEARYSSKCLHSITDLERISDHAVNVMELAAELHEKKLTFSAAADTELSICNAAVREILDIAFGAFISDDLEMAHRVEPLKQVIEEMAGAMKSSHIERVQAGKCTLELGFVFNDLLNNFERVADHCSNVALSVIEMNDLSFESHGYFRSLKSSQAENYAELVEEYKKKYYIRLPYQEEVPGLEETGCAGFDSDYEQSALHAPSA